jgi:peroxiredoxin
MALSLSGRAQKEMNSFTIKGSFVNMEAPGKVYLAYDTAHYQPTDSAVVTNGKYVFHGKTDGVAHLFISKKWWDRRAGGWELRVVSSDRAEVFLEKGTVEVISSGGDMEKSVVTGSLPDKDYRAAHLHQTLLRDSIRAIARIARDTKNDVLFQKLIMQAMVKGDPIMKADYVAFVRQHPASPINIYLLDQLSRVERPIAGWLDTVASIYDGLPADLRISPDGMRFERYLGNELKTALGHMAPDFTQNDVQGHPVSLYSFKGKYVLLDFWASWDNNAARALPVLEKVYETYGSKGLVVLGVSLDKDKDSWQQVIQDAGAGSTMQVSDLKGRENAAARLYGITTLPRNILIDPSGIIVAKNLNSFDIDKTLSSIFE